MTIFAYTYSYLFLSHGPVIGHHPTILLIVAHPYILIHVCRRIQTLYTSEINVTGSLSRYSFCFISPPSGPLPLCSHVCTDI